MTPGLLERFAPILLLAMFTSTSATAQATGSCAPELVGSPSCPYQWVGATSVAFIGNGNGLGFVGMTTQCRADFGAGARVCTSEEILGSDTLNPNAIPAQGCWLRPSWRGFKTGVNGHDTALDESGVVARVGPISQDQATCLSWQVGDNTFQGLTLLPAGNFFPQGCATARPVACCKPIAVGEPQASMMLPTGVGVLAMLSMVRGGG